MVLKRSGDRVPFDRTKIEAGLRAAAKGRPLDAEVISAMAVRIEDQARLIGGGDVASEQIGLAVLDQLRDVDQVAYVRFASVYKGFDDPADFEREVGLLTGGLLASDADVLTKESEPKRHEVRGG